MSDDCNNCKWAEWEMTKGTRPRVNPNQPGKCAYPVAVPLLPAASSIDNLARKIESSRLAIWKDDPYSDCPTWERRQ